MSGSSHQPAAGHRPVLYASRDDFLLDDSRRLTSPQASYGAQWTLPHIEWPRWRVGYIRDTREIFATACATDHTATRILGLLDPDPAPGWPSRGDRWDRTLCVILDGWGFPERHGNQLIWVIGRLRAAGVLMPCELNCPMPYAPGMATPCDASNRCARMNPQWMGDHR
jgi:hypothetical protein